MSLGRLRRNPERGQAKPKGGETVNNNFYPALKGKIAAEYGSQSAFAAKVGLEPITVSRRLNGQTAFTRDEIMRWAAALHIKKKDIVSYFFDDKVGV